MNTGTIISLVLLLVVSLIFTEIYLKRKLNIKSKWMGTMGKSRKRIFVSLEAVVLLSFIFSMVFLYDHDSALIRVTPMFSLFFLNTLLRGLELWIYERDNRAYIHEWVGSIVIMLAYFILLIGEGL